MSSNQSGKSIVKMLWMRLISNQIGHIKKTFVFIILIIFLYLLFESNLEEILNAYWVSDVITKIQSHNLLVWTAGILLVMNASYQIRIKNFTFNIFELSLLLFYWKYRFLDDFWIYYPEAQSIKYFDAIPIFLLGQKTIALVSFIKDFQIGEIRAGSIDPDLPLSKENPYDELSRSKFANELSTILTNIRPSKRALVIGISGGWGSGKSSLQFLIEQALKASKKIDDFYYINFNPWLHSGQRQLVESFLESFRSKVEEDQYLIAKSIRSYGRALVAGAEKWIWSDNFLDKFLDGRTDNDKLDMLRAKVGNLKKTLLVSIDDIDRLHQEELVEVLRLVRLVGDFPNTIYIILYDKDHVNAAVKQAFGDQEQSSFLDKVVQVEFSIPELYVDDLKAIFSKRLTEVLELAIDKNEEFWTQNDINDVLQFDSFGYFIRNIRDVKRLTNNFIIRYKLIYKEVNFKQFLLIEMLRYRHPELVQILFKSMDVFIAQIAGNAKFLKPDYPIENLFWTDLINNEDAKNVLKKVAEYNQELRSITNKTFFQNYFTLVIGDNFITESAFNANAKSSLNSTAKETYQKWLITSIDSLIYRFRNYSILGIDEFLKFVEHLSFCQNILRGIDKNNSYDDVLNLTTVFVSQYELVRTQNIDASLLYKKLFEYLHETEEIDSSLQNAFKNTSRILISFDYTDSPLAHGWKIHQNKSVDKLSSIFHPNNDNDMGQYMHFSAPFEYRFDFDFKETPSFLTNLTTTIKHFDKEWAFYIRVNASKGTEYRELLFRILNQSSSLGKVSEMEFTIGLQPDNLDNDWLSFSVDIEQLFRRSFKAEGYKLLEVSGIAIKGYVSLLRCELY